MNSTTRLMLCAVIACLLASCSERRGHGPPRPHPPRRAAVEAAAGDSSAARGKHPPWAWGASYLWPPNRPHPPGPIFHALDIDGDHSLSASEIEKASASLRKLDRNMDGVVTLRELVASRELLDVPGDSGGPHADRQAPALQGPNRPDEPAAPSDQEGQSEYQEGPTEDRPDEDLASPHSSGSEGGAAGRSDTLPQRSTPVEATSAAAPADATDR